MEELLKEQRKTNELLEKLLNKDQDEIKMLFIKDVAKIMGVNQDAAGKLWDREDFPRN